MNRAEIGFMIFTIIITCIFNVYSVISIRNR